MAFTPEEQAIIDWGKQNGKSLTETKAALARYRNSSTGAQAVEQTGTDQQGVGEILGGTQRVLNTIFGGQKIGETIGAQIAKLTPGGRELRRQVREGEITKEQAGDTLRSPRAKEIVGDVARVGATFLPVGRIAQGLGRVGQAIGLGSRASRMAGNVGAGAATGATADIGVSLAEEGEAQIGLGTLLGAGIPAASPVAKAIGRASARFTGRAGAEITGALTGTSAETVEQAFEAARAGGRQLDDFTNSLRGRTTPEQLVNTMRENVDLVAKNRSALFAETLAELGDEVVATAPAKTAFRETLEKVGITVRDDGTLNFANNKLRNVPEAQKKIQQAWDEVINMPEQLSITDLDTTRQATKAIKEIAGDDPSANLANMVIEDAARSVRKAGEQVKGYGTMLDNFAETSEFLDELQRGLSSGDNRTIDQAYRRIATTLKTNNEQRMALVRELDEATDGAILSEISGQQLSEVLPRGIFRQISAGIAGGAAFTGTVNPGIIPALVLASPRVVGEFTRSLGIGAAKAAVLADAVSDARNVLLKIGAIGGAEVENSSE